MANESQPVLSMNSAAWAGVGQANAADDVFFDAAELAQLRFDDDPLRVGAFDDAAGRFNVLLERFVRGVRS